MILIVCLDDKNGMMFNNRRQSKDRKLIEDVIELTGENIIYMNEYSYGLFKDYKLTRIKVEEDCLEQAKAGDYCFIEDMTIGKHQDKIEKIVVYRWNKVYPSDKKLDFALESFNLEKLDDFKGFSHDVITREIYK